jgi:hypothetical protein
LRRCSADTNKIESRITKQTINQDKTNTSKNNWHWNDKFQHRHLFSV